MVILPAEHLYIEALPGTHPVLEEFKMQHRALDVAKARAELRQKELENLRRAARIVAGDLGETEADRKIVIEDGPASVVATVTTEEPGTGAPRP